MGFDLVLCVYVCYCKVLYFWEDMLNNVCLIDYFGVDVEGVL